MDAKRILLAIGWGVMSLFVVPDCSAIQVQAHDRTLAEELPAIAAAAERNNCLGDDLLLLLAIRKAENGRAGCEFGVKHPKAWNTNLDTQAGWAAATIIKHHGRFGSDQVTEAFINSLADRYCPKETDPTGNANWKKNVQFWFKKFKG